MLSSPIHTIAHTDIYLIDQILKGRYLPGDRLLDAGVGSGRNLPWFVENGLDVYATDLDVKAIARLPAMFNTLPTAQLLVAPVEKLPFEAEFFDHIVCSAVLHFAQNTTHFHQMLAELIRVLRPGGSLFVRMASDIGLETKAIPLAEGVYRIPDGSNRFLLNRKLLAEILQAYPIELAETFKTTNVADQRCMSTLILLKK